MVAQGHGLIVTVSSMGGLKYVFNVAYGVGKAAVRGRRLLVSFWHHKREAIIRTCLLLISSLVCLCLCFQCDRLAADMAVELKSRGVVSVSLWPGPVRTELITQFMQESDPVMRGMTQGKQVN